MRARDFLSRAEKEQVIDAVRRAELVTGGEIRIHIENRCKDDPRESALRTFHILGMDATAARNAVLLYVATESRKVAVIADKGVDALVPKGYWDGICRLMTGAFARGEYARGLADAVEEVGRLLAEKFPYSEDDVNELPDDISYGEEE